MILPSNFEPMGITLPFMVTFFLVILNDWEVSVKSATIHIQAEAIRILSEKYTPTNNVQCSAPKINIMLCKNIVLRYNLLSYYILYYIT